MPIIFQNPGLIDLRAVQIMGLHAKESPAAIGQFGTGLKYAIAVLLRNRCSISVWRGLEETVFSTQKESFREKEFDFVYMNNPWNPLGFTLELGKNWEMWQAIRELESNCRDEGGRSFQTNDWTFDEKQTTIVLSGIAAETVYSELPDIFISDKPLWENKDFAIHRLQHPEQGKWAYYRSVRCAPLEKPALFRYNIKSEQLLTEDRTFLYPWEAPDRTAENVSACTNKEILAQILDPPSDNCFEFDLSFQSYNLSDEFSEMVEGIGPRCLPKAWAAHRRKIGAKDFEEVEMDDFQHAMLSRAIAFIEKMGEKRIHDFPILMANDLGKNCLGRWFKTYKTIYIAQRTFEMGLKPLISCLYEEYIHADRGFKDNNYEMQNFLFDTIITMASRHLGEPI